MNNQTNPLSADKSTELFPEVIPWEQPVDGEQLLSEIKDFVQRHIVCEDYTATAVTVWIAFTWFINVVSVAPIANITAPMPNCGKSTLLDLMELLVKKPIKVDNISPAALFRTVEKWQPTLLIDEVDAFLKGNEDARGIINSGHKPNGKVLRLVGNNHEPHAFSTWGAKALCGIGAIAATLDSRSIRLELRRKMPGENTANLRHASRSETDKLARQLARFYEDSHGSVKNARPEPIPHLNNRAQDNWEPLLAIADAAGGKWPAEVRKAAIAISSSEANNDQTDTKTELLQDIHKIFTQTGKERLFSSDLMEALYRLEESPWDVWNKGKPITTRQLSKLLGGFGIRPSDIRIGVTVRKGYTLDKFEDSFKRYLPDASTVPLQRYKPHHT